MRYRYEKKEPDIEVFEERRTLWGLFFAFIALPPRHYEKNIHSHRGEDGASSADQG